MLSELQISNFALIEHQAISFGPGLNVISGETGAGKSIILQALQFLLGEKPRAQAIRAGAEELEVQGLFSLEHLPREMLQKLPDIAQQSDLALTRSFNSSGRGKVYINGKLSSVSLLEEITSQIINICGQSQHVQLLDAKKHIEVLDGYAGLQEEVSSYRELYAICREKRAAMEQAASRQEALREKEELLRAQYEELKAAGLYQGIRAELEVKIRRLGSAEKLAATAKRVLALLQEEGGALSLLQRGSIDVQELVKLDPDFAPRSEMFVSARTELKEFSAELEEYLGSISLDDQTLASFRERLAEVARLERKYKSSDDGLLDVFARVTRELEEIDRGGDVSGLGDELGELEKQLGARASKLHQGRMKAAKKLSGEVTSGLSDLNMADARFDCKVENYKAESGELGPYGSDKVEFLLAPNRGEAVHELRKIASGGELSRILLVLKEVLSDRTGVNVLVFDEVDTGISGGVARSVGLKLKSLARHSQVICVTHLAQVASLADHHFLVGKQSGERTISLINEIFEDQRIEEIARMLAGYKVTPTARASARELMSSKS